MNQEELAKYVSDSFECAKNGAASDRYNELLPYFENGSLPMKSHYAFGWICYYALHQSAEREIVRRKQILATYLRLTLAKPHKLHSMVLTEAVRLYKDAAAAAFNHKQDDAPSFSILRFCDLWDLSNLRPGDWRRKELEGKQISSTAEKLVTVCTDELEKTSAAPSSSLMSVIDRALSEFPDTPSLLAQRASIHAMAGENTEARKLLRLALINAPGKFHLWSRLAALTPPEDNLRLHVALLYKSLKAPGQEQFKGRVRLSLAKALLSRDMYPLALAELDKVAGIYKSNGWHLPKAYAEAMKRIPEETIAKDAEPLYRKVEHLADDEVYAALPAVSAVKTYHKNPSPESSRKGFGRPAAAWQVTASDGSRYWLQPHRFGIPADLPLGTPLLIFIHNGKTVRATLAPPPTL